MQVKDTEMKSRLSSGPTHEQIALATDASRVLNSENESGLQHRHRGSSDDDLFGGEHSALLDLLRQDERLSGLLSGAGVGRGNRPGRDRDGDGR